MRPASVVTALSVGVGVCSCVHVCVESWSTVGLDGRGLEVDDATGEVPPGTAVVVVVTTGPQIGRASCRERV